MSIKDNYRLNQAIIEENIVIIPTTKKQFIIVDRKDYENIDLLKRLWYAVKIGYDFYAYIKINKKHTSMHRLIMNCEKDKVVHHKNHNGLDNRRENLVTCTRTENQRHQRIRKQGKNKSSKYKGVSYSENTTNKWAAYIGFNSKKIHLGYWATQKQAAIAYNKRAAELFGDFALLNEV